MNRWGWHIARVGTVALVFSACDTEERAPDLDAGEGHLIRVSGSDDAYPLVRGLARHFEERNAGYRVEFAAPTHTRGGVASVSVGDADIGLVSRPLTPREREGQSTYLHLAHDLLVFATHRDMEVEGLSGSEILDIYRGQITNWKEVGGHDAPITVLDRAEHTSLKILMRQQLFGDSLAVAPNAIVLERPDDMMTALASVENSVGYISFGNAVLADLNVNHLSVDGVKPSLESFLRGAYPFHRPFGFFIQPRPSRATMRFIKFMYGEEARRITEGDGYAPVTMDLIVAVLPEQNLLAQEERYAPLVEYLGERMGLHMTVELRLLPDYGTVIEEFQAGRINAAFLGSLAFALAHAQAGVEPIARPEKDGVSQYRGLIVTRKDSGITNWTHLRGKSFGLVDKATTAGYLFPLIYLRERGVTRLEDYVASVSYTGSHDLLFLSVLNGELDAGAAKDLMLEEVAKTRPEIKESLRTIAVSPPVPNNAFVLSCDLDFPCFRCHELVPSQPGAEVPMIPRQPEELTELLTALLLGLHESAPGREVLESLGADRFVETTVDDLREVNRMIERAGYDPKDYRP
jgi:phosphate/phosphite/phosphonate ABC transporter binding protein